MLSFQGHKCHLEYFPIAMFISAITVVMSLCLAATPATLLLFPLSSLHQAMSSTFLYPTLRLGRDQMPTAQHEELQKYLLQENHRHGNYPHHSRKEFDKEWKT